MANNHGCPSIVHPVKDFSHCKIRFIEGIVEEWFENIPKEMSVI